MALRHRTALVSLLAAPIVALLAAGAAHGAVVTPDQVASVTVKGPFLPLIGVPTSPVTFSSQGDGTTPVKYEYWVNGGKHKTVKAAADGTAAVYLTFTTHQNMLSVEGVGADGTTGYVSTNFYDADGALPAAPNDSNGDGVPDLLAVGDPAGVGSGLWLANGNAAGYLTGRVRVPALNIGANGIGQGASYYDGAKIFTGNLLGDNLQDVMVYFVSGPRAGVGLILPGTGDGSVESGNEFEGAGLDYFTDANGNTPIDLANAFNASNANNITPDLIGISGSATTGYQLATYASYGWPLGYTPELSANKTPTGGTDWQNWQLISTSVFGSGTSIYLWNSTTGALYLWQGVAFTDNGDGTSSVAYTQYRIAKNWNTGATFSTVEAADFTGDGIPDLWTVTPAGVARAYVVSNLSVTSLAQISAKAPQTLS